MKTPSERMAEYVRYHMTGDADCPERTLGLWADLHGLSEPERFELAYLFAITYNPPSAVYLFEHRDAIRRDPAGFARRAHDRIIFETDRKYVRIGDRFSRCLEEFASRLTPAERTVQLLAKGGRLDIPRAVREVESWYYFGRYSAFLLLEAFLDFTGMRFTNASIDWKHGDTATSGLLNLYCFDAEADRFDRTGRLLVDLPSMDAMLDSAIAEIEAAGGDGNVLGVESTLCAYRKFYKGSRYNGYYLDRMLQEIRRFKALNPSFDADELLQIRRSLFPADKLGELSGWDGVRPELKRLYQRTGRIAT